MRQVGVSNEDRSSSIAIGRSNDQPAYQTMLRNPLSLMIEEMPEGLQH